MSDRFANIQLVVLGHGSTENDQSAAPVHQHVEALRGRRLFAAVHGAFWKQTPRVTDVLPTLNHPVIVIVPLFISEGYFTEQAIPEALGFKEPGSPDWRRERIVDGRSVRFARPVGTHPDITRLVRHRATEIVNRHPFPSRPAPAASTLVIAGHGTPRDPRSRLSIEEQVRRLDQEGEFVEVRSAFIEEPPRIADIPEAAGSKNVVVVPFFIADGLHVSQDIPLLLGEPEKSVRQRLAAGQPAWRNPTERNGKRIWVGDPVGTDPGMADLIIARAGEALEAG